MTETLPALGVRGEDWAHHVLCDEYGRICRDRNILGAMHAWLERHPFENPDLDLVDEMVNDAANIRFVAHRLRAKMPGCYTLWDGIMIRERHMAERYG